MAGRVVVFTPALRVRDYRPGDRAELIGLYQDVFAGDIELDNGEVFSWGEYMKCEKCEVKYTRQEVSELWASDELTPPCKKCGLDVSLEPYWSSEKVESIINSTLEKSEGKVKVALVDDELVGFAMYFVNPYAPDIGYFADIGVDQSKRKNGVATGLLRTLNEWAEENNLSSVYLRTDARNRAAVSLFEANGFEKTGSTEQDDSVQDNEYRIYLRKEMAAPKERCDS